MSVLGWLQSNKELVSKYIGSILTIAVPWIDEVEFIVRVLSGGLGIALTSLLIYKALLDIRKTRKEQK